MIGPTTRDVLDVYLAPTSASNCVGKVLVLPRRCTARRVALTCRCLGAHEGILCTDLIDDHVAGILARPI